MEWFIGGSAPGTANLRVVIVLTAVGAYGILTLTRHAVATVLVRRRPPHLTWLVHTVTLLRALVVAESVAPLLWAGHLADPGRPSPIIASGEVPDFDLSRFLTYVGDPMALLVGILTGLTVRSTRRSLTRAHRAATSR